MPGFPRWDIDGIVFGHEYTDQLHLIRMLCRHINTGGQDLLGLVRTYGTMTQCSNPRDTFYAFLDMAQESPDLPAIVPDYEASAAEVLLQAWLRNILQSTTIVRPASPGPFMNMLAFTYTDDCQFADFLLDVFETQFVHVLIDLASRTPQSPFYHAFIDAFQAIYNSGRRSQGQRLGNILPPKIEWFKTRSRAPNGSPMTSAQREQETFRRFAIDKQFLWNCREELRQAGRWPYTRNLRRLVDPSQFRLPLTPPAPSAVIDPAFTGGSWITGTQPMQNYDEKNRPSTSRRWYQTKKRGVWERASAIDTRKTRLEFDETSAQSMFLLGEDYIGMPYMFGLEKLSA